LLRTESHYSSIRLRPDTNICLSVRNPLSDYEIRERVAFNLQETVLQDEGSREPPLHFSLSWDGAKKHSTIVVLDDAATKTALKKAKKKKLPGGEFSYLTYTSEHSGMPIPILALECRGLEPYAFHCLGSDQFIVESMGGVKFESDIDFSDGDWAEYDEQNDASVSVEKFVVKIECL
jgi:Eukaryotic protein of unknown function (DUF866)